jgi:flavin-dependent dehydrogenase
MSTDVLVLGAGPGGCAAARILASWGHRVLVVDRSDGESCRLAESIPPSAQRVLRAIGALPAIEDAGFLPWRGNIVWWGEEAPRVETFPPGVAGYQVARRDLDRRLRDLAIAAGAELRVGIVREVVVAGAAGDPEPAGEPAETPRAILEVDGQSVSVSASFVLDCSGRAGVLARRGFRRTAASHHTIALAGIWKAASAWPETSDTQTLVASYADGWAWSVPTAPGVRHFTVMVDPARTDLARASSSRDIYLSELAKVRAFGPMLAGAALVDGPFGADASPYDAVRYAGPGFLLVGDAASFIDPLSSFGVKKALASGWLAAIVTHTALTRPAMRDAALGFHDRRERELFASAERQAARFAAGVTSGGASHPFWLARASSRDDSDLDGEVDAAALGRDAAVVAAFEDLRRRPAIHFRPGANVRVEPRPAVRGREIALQDHLMLPGWPDGVRYLRNVDLLALWKAAPAHTDVGDLCAAMATGQPGVALPDMLGALAVLIARGALRHG